GSKYLRTSHNTPNDEWIRLPCYMRRGFHTGGDSFFDKKQRFVNMHICVSGEPKTCHSSARIACHRARILIARRNNERRAIGKRIRWSEFVCAHFRWSGIRFNMYRYFGETRDHHRVRTRNTQYAGKIAWPISSYLEHERLRIGTFPYE